MNKLKNIWDKRILDLMHEAIAKGIAESKKDWGIKIGIGQSNITQVEKGERSFTVEQIVNAAKLTKTSTDWILGLTNSRLPKKSADGIELIKEGLRLIDKHNKNI